MEEAERRRKKEKEKMGKNDEEVETPPTQDLAPPNAVGQEKASSPVTRPPPQTTVQTTQVKNNGGKDLNSFKTNRMSERVQARDVAIDHRAVRSGKRKEAKRKEEKECKSAHIPEEEPPTQHQSASMSRKSGTPQEVEEEGDEE